MVDTFKDGRFYDNPLIIGEPWVRSYISYVLQSEMGMNVGTLCMVDTSPRKFDDNEKDLIIELGTMVEELFLLGHHGTAERIDKIN